MRLLEWCGSSVLSICAYVSVFVQKCVFVWEINMIVFENFCKRWKLKIGDGKNSMRNSILLDTVCVFIERTSTPSVCIVHVTIK